MRLIDADSTLTQAWENFYKQEEEHEKVYEDYDILRDRHFEQSGFECCQQTIVNAPTYNEWIYRTMPDEGVDFDKIEKALGFKLFVWQKTFITRGVFRQYGETTARCIRRLLQKDNPIDYRMGIAHAQEFFERQEMIRIHDQLQAAGVEVCEILRPERKKHET